VGIARIGPRRQRLSPSEHKARQQADLALARTLAAERELKEQWRREIRAEIADEFSDELARWKQRCLDQNARLAAANNEMSDLRARLAELESQIEPPSGRMP
jgi:chromosome segregation ATPase